ncbi:MAG: hypothetical protein HZB13_01370 [Acidobacteria bacterium]|nr:hypothetical protein [Acidobacteriota bacterium]
MDSRRQDAHERPLARLRVAVLVVLCTAILLVLAELGAKAAARISRIERRTTEEISSAVRMRGGRADGVRTVLLAGNSLLLEGVDLPALQQELRPAVEVERLVVEGTAYLDWYYALRRLFSEGSRPDVVVLKLSAIQLLSDGIRGDYSANRLFALGDLLDVSRDAGYSMTATSSLLFAHYSTYYGTRMELRKWFLSELMPGMKELQPRLARLNRKPASESAIRRRVPARLAELQRLANQHGAHLVLLLPATSAERSESRALFDAARKASTVVLEPAAPGAFPAALFSDGFHLNAGGKRAYTQALAPLL